MKLANELSFVTLNRCDETAYGVLKNRQLLKIYGVKLAAHPKVKLQRRRINVPFCRRGVRINCMRRWQM